MSAEAFYRERDRRTEEYGVVAGLSTAPVQIVVGEDAAECPRGQLLLLSLINLLARFHRSLIVVVPPRPLISARPLGRVQPSAHTDLRDAALAMAVAIDPYIRVETCSGKTESASIGIGRGAERLTRWQIGAAGNIVQLATEAQPADEQPGFALGPCLAACIAAWALFRQVMGEPFLPQRISAWNLRAGDTAIPGPTHLDALEVGRCLVVGAGGVGSCLAYWLAQAGVIGPWLVVDGDFAELHNTNRCMGILAADSGWFSGAPAGKAELAAGLIGAAVRTCWYHQLTASDLHADLVLPLANERGVRTAISQRGDPILLHASTSRLFEAQLHRHIPERDDCLLCRLPPNNPGAVFGCATVPVGTPERQDDAALAFLSASAALMLMSALYRLSAGELENEAHNFFRLVYRSVTSLPASGRYTCRESCPGGLPRRARAVASRRSRWSHLDPKAVESRPDPA